MKKFFVFRTCCFNYLRKRSTPPGPESPPTRLKLELWFTKSQLEKVCPRKFLNILMKFDSRILHSSTNKISWRDLGNTSITMKIPQTPFYTMKYFRTSTNPWNCRPRKSIHHQVRKTHRKALTTMTNQDCNSSTTHK